MLLLRTTERNLFDWFCVLAFSACSQIMSLLRRLKGCGLDSIKNLIVHISFKIKTFIIKSQNFKEHFRSQQSLKNCFIKRVVYFWSHHLLMWLDGVTKTTVWWRWTGSNRWPSRCKRDALPAELHPHIKSGGPRWIWTIDLTLIRRAL